MLNLAVNSLQLQMPGKIDSLGKKNGKHLIIFPPDPSSFSLRNLKQPCGMFRNLPGQVPSGPLITRQTQMSLESQPLLRGPTLEPQYRRASPRLLLGKHDVPFPLVPLSSAGSVADPVMRVLDGMSRNSWRGQEVG